MHRNNDPVKFKRYVSNIASGLNVITHVNVTWDPDRNKIEIKHDKKFCPDFELKYSERYNAYHVYIYVKSRDGDEKVNAGYTIMRIDSALAVCELVSMIQMLYRRRPGPNWDSSGE